MYKFKEGARVVFYGDSITHGGIWLRRVYDYYLNVAKIKCEMYNFGVSGNTAKRAYARINRIYDFDPTDVVIMFGMNDVSYSSFNKDGGFSDEELKRIRDTRDENFEYYKKICAELSEKGINIIFCTPTVYDELSDIETKTNFGAVGAIKEYADRVVNLAKNYGNNVVDFNTAFFNGQKRAYKEGHSLISGDRVHPNKAGYELMAKYFLFCQGFDVKYDLDYAGLEKESVKPFSAWEEERHALEEKAKSCDYARYDYFWLIKDEDELVAATKRALETHEAASWAQGDTLDYVEGCFKNFLKDHEKVEDALKEYIAFTKTAMK